MDTQFIGKRCRMRSLAYDNVTGAPMRGLTGIIRQRVENLGRVLLLVDWEERAEASFVFPGDIEVLPESVPGAAGSRTF
jgi:hypothetical protein